METDAALRIDRYLWFTRFYKTRTLAAKAVGGGHVRVNGERARPGQKVTAGDKVELNRDQLTWRFEVLGLPARRGPASEARTFYREDGDAAEKREALKVELAADRRRMPRTPGRPDKHTRRLLRRAKGS